MCGGGVGVEVIWPVRVSHQNLYHIEQCGHWLRSHTDHTFAHRIRTTTHLDHRAGNHGEHVLIHRAGHYSKPEVLVFLEETAQSFGRTFDKHM